MVSLVLSYFDCSPILIIQQINLLQYILIEKILDPSIRNKEKKMNLLSMCNYQDSSPKKKEKEKKPTQVFDKEGRNLNTLTLTDSGRVTTDTNSR